MVAAVAIHKAVRYAVIGTYTTVQVSFCNTLILHTLPTFNGVVVGEFNVCAFCSGSVQQQGQRWETCSVGGMDFVYFPGL